ncbi:hypothetical protein GGH17_004257, partial [Coemansia sp. RSA 788]
LTTLCTTSRSRRTLMMLWQMRSSRRLGSFARSSSRRSLICQRRLLRRLSKRSRRSMTPSLCCLLSAKT